MFHLDIPLRTMLAIGVWEHSLLNHCNVRPPEMRTERVIEITECLSIGEIIYLYTPIPVWCVSVGMCRCVCVCVGL